MKKDELRDYLYHCCRGRENEASSQRVRQAIRVSESDLHKLVNRLRREGEPVCSDQGGYFYARTAGEVVGTVAWIDKMIAGMQAARKGLLVSLDSFTEERDAP